MVNRVEERSTVSFAGKYYNITGPVHKFSADQTPQKFSTGDVGLNDRILTSAVAWTQAPGGIGLERFQGDVGRDWWSTWNTSVEGHTVLPDAYVTTSPSVGTSGHFSVNFIAELNNSIFAGFSTSVQQYATTTNTWTEVHTLPNIATDSSTIRLNGTVYLVIAHKTGYTYTSDGVTWNDEVTDIKEMAFFDDRLWGIDATGQLRWTDDLSPGTPTWTDDAQLPLPDNYAEGMLVGRDAAGNQALYVTSRVGLWIHDAVNQRLRETEVSLPYHPFHCKGGAKWREGVYIASGMDVYEYLVGDQAVVRQIGPSNDNGVPDDKRGVITQVLGDHRRLLALVDASTIPVDPPAASLVDGNSFSTHHAGVMETGTGYSYILGWNGQGWHVVWISDADTKPIVYALISNAFNRYRMWWGHNQKVYYMDLPVSASNPTEDSTHKYDTRTHTHEYPWFDNNQSGRIKTGVRVHLEMRGMSANETTTLKYYKDWDTTSATTLGSAITTNGVTTFELPNATTPNGLEFEAIRFFVEGVGAATDAFSSPDIIRLEFEYVAYDESKFGFEFEIDLDHEVPGGGTPEELHEALDNALALRTFPELTYRNRDANSDGDSNPYNYYVKIVGFDMTELTGNDWSGKVQIQAVEV